MKLFGANTGRAPDSTGLFRQSLCMNQALLPVLYVNKDDIIVQRAKMEMKLNVQEFYLGSVLFFTQGYDFSKKCFLSTD